MRFICFLVAFALMGQPARDPGVIVSAWYNGPRVKPPQPLKPSVSDEVLRADLADIRSGGFNGITTWISWRDGEPSRGVLNLAQLDRVVGFAAEIGLHVQIEVYTADEPSWKKDGTNALAGTFYSRVRDRYAGRRRVEVGYAVATSRSNDRQIRITPHEDSWRSVAPHGRLQLWSLIAQGHKRIGFMDEDGVATPDMRAIGEAAGVITRNEELFGPLQRRTQNNRVIVEPGGIDADILESPDAIVIIALNRDERPRQRKLTFPPDIPEAIWQDMIAGNAVNFVMGPHGPYYEHRFEEYETLVLAIRKKLR